MRALITFILLLSFTFTMSAQQTKRSFVGKQEIKWLNEEVEIFENSLAKLNKAYKNADNEVISQNKSRAIASINRLSANTPIIMKSIQDFIDKDHEENMVEQISDEPRNVTYKSLSKKDFLEHLVLFDADLAKLHESTEAISKLQKAINENGFDFFVSEENSEANLEISKKLLHLAKEFNSILQKSKV